MKGFSICLQTGQFCCFWWQWFFPFEISHLEVPRQLLVMAAFLIFLTGICNIWLKANWFKDSGLKPYRTSVIIMFRMFSLRLSFHHCNACFQKGTIFLQVQNKCSVVPTAMLQKRQKGEDFIFICQSFWSEGIMLWIILNWKHLSLFSIVILNGK